MTRTFVLGALLALVAPVAVQAAEDKELGHEPYQLVRSLRLIQDKVARGSEQAHVFQRQFIERITHSILTAEPDAWKDRRNVRAAIIYALSGGDPRVLRDVMTKFILSEADDGIWRGAIAYAEGRTGEASRLLLPLDARKLDPSLGGQIALVQAVLMVRREPAKAVALLDDARLLAPGTLIEEAALRRQVTLLAASGDLDLFENRSLHYLRRYGRSVYVSGFLQSFVRVLVTTPEYATNRARVEALKTRLDDLDPLVKRDTYLAIAEEAIVRGRVELTRLAARRATELVKDGSVASIRLKVYDAAAMIVSEDFDQGFAALKAIDRSRLEEADASLLDAAIAMAGEVRKAPEVTELIPVPPNDVRKRAERAISKVDDLLPR
jgi:chemotaxis protein MotC